MGAQEKAPLPDCDRLIAIAAKSTDTVVRSPSL
jgi:hypothetical protein